MFSLICPWTYCDPRSSLLLSENCEDRGTDYACRQMPDLIFTPNGGDCSFIREFNRVAGILFWFFLVPMDTLFVWSALQSTPQQN